MPPRGRVPIIPFLIAATILTFWPVCGGQFTLWDDSGVIAHEPTLLPPTWHSVVAWWTRPIQYLYIPVGYTAWGLIALIAQRPGEYGVMLSPYPFHIANLLLHVLTVIVVYRLLALLVKKPWPAAAGAAIFALHPVQVEPVAWAMGLRDVLCGLFTVTALWQYLLAARTPFRAGVYDSGLSSLQSSTTRASRWHYAAATVAYALALLSKPSAITTPLIAAVLEISMVSSRIDFSATPRRSRRIPPPPGTIGRLRRGVALRRGMLLRLGLWLAMAIPIALIARQQQPVYRVSETVPILHRPMVALDAIAFYVGKIAWPANLCIDYGRSPMKIFDSHQAYWTWLIPAAIAAGLAIWARRRRVILAGAAVFAIGLLPVLGFVGFDFQSYSTVADRFLYVPMIGVAILAAAILASPAIIRHGRIVAVAVVLILGALALPSFRQTWVWQDTDTLFAHSLQIDPLGPAVNDTRARYALEAHQFEKAEKYAEASIRGNPKRSQPYLMLAQALRQLKQRWQAMEAANAAYAIEPNDPDVVMAVAVLMDDADNPAAEAMYRRAIQMGPTLPETHLNLAIHLANSGHESEAIAELRKATAAASTDPSMLAQIGDELAGLGQTASARAAYESALRLQRDFRPAIDGLMTLPNKSVH